MSPFSCWSYDCARLCVTWGWTPGRRQCCRRFVGLIEVHSRTWWQMVVIRQIVVVCSLHKGQGKHKQNKQTRKTFSSSCSFVALEWICVSKKHWIQPARRRRYDWRWFWPSRFSTRSFYLRIISSQDKYWEDPNTPWVVMPFIQFVSLSVASQHISMYFVLKYTVQEQNYRIWIWTLDSASCDSLTLSGKFLLVVFIMGTTKRSK